MTTSLPTVISDYLAAADRGDLDALVACFTDDAVVLDEDQEWRGQAGLRQWRETVANAYDYTVEVRGAAEQGWSTASNVTTFAPISRATSPAAPSI
jgi:ketosteroid isomerase-like protein